MKILLVAIIFFLTLTSCDKEYLVKNGHVYLKEWNEANGTSERLVTGADARTFRAIETDDNLLIGKDQQHVFLDGGILEGADPQTLIYLGNYFFADKSAVYFFGYKNDSSRYEIMGANPGTTKATKQYPWAYDDKHVIHGQDVLKVLDSGSLTPLSQNWARTASAVFYEGKIVPNADVKTFQVIDDYSGKDKYRQYHEN